MRKLRNKRVKELCLGHPSGSRAPADLELMGLCTFSWALPWVNSWKQNSRAAILVVHLAHCTILGGAIHKKTTLWLIHPLWLCSAQPRQFYAMAQTAVPPKAAKLNQHFVYITPSFCSPKQSVAENYQGCGLVPTWSCILDLPHCTDTRPGG